MGVYFDYFCAENDDVARETRSLVGGPLVAEPAYDGVSTKGLFPDPHVEQLVALVENVPYQRGPETSARLWPPPDTPPPTDESSPWLTDPSIERLATRIRDALAGVDPARVPGLGAAWAAELVDFSADDATAALADLVALARRAQHAGQELYCWSSL